MKFDVPRMPDPRRDEPTPFARLPKAVQDAIVAQWAGGGVSGSVARAFLLNGEGADIDPPDLYGESFAGRRTVTFERGAPIRGEGGRFGGSEPGTVEDSGGGNVAKVSDVVDSQLRKNLAKSDLLTDASNKPVLGSTPRNRELQAGIDSSLAQIDSVHGMPADTGVGLTFHALSGNASAEGQFIYSASGNPDVPTIITVKNGDELEVSVSHEVGHYLDYSDLGTDAGQFGSGSLVFGADGAQVIGASEFMAPVMEALLDTPEVQQLVDARLELERGGSVRMGEYELSGSGALRALEYLTDPKEMFARAYSQFIATESESEAGLAQIAANTGDLAQGTPPYQWTTDTFWLVGDAIRDSLSVAGLLHSDDG